MEQNQNDAEWSIEARAFSIRRTPFSHNFWTLSDPAGTIAGQLHGLAVDPSTGQAMAFGNSRHLLQVIDDPSIGWSLRPGQPVAVCARGSKTEIITRWQSALTAIPALNALNLRYPDLWQHIYKGNSNSVFNTLGQIMGFSAPSRLLPTLAPGIHLVLAPELVKKFAYKS